MRTAPGFRWLVIFLLFAATAISYVDRQVLTVLAPTLRDDFGITNTGYASILTTFLLAYTFMQPVTGWLIDRLGTRIGFALIMGWWSVAAMMHAAGSSIASFAFFRFLLGAGEAGSWAACVKAVSEWFPGKERGFATGLWSSGVSAGLVISVPIVAWISLTLGWRWAFILTGLSGLAWLVAWLWLYRSPDVPAEPSGETAVADARTPRPSYATLLRSRNVWTVVVARLLADPWAWFYYFWIPEYLTRTAGFTPADIGRYAWIPFLAQGVGIVTGGALSDFLCRRGSGVVTARMTIMSLGMLLMTFGILAAFKLDIVLIFAAISAAMLGFGFWAPNMMSLCADAFPKLAVGSVAGLGGMGAGIGGMLFTMLIGWTLDHFGYAPVFVAAGTIPLAACAILLLLFDRRAADRDGLPQTVRV